MLTKDMNTNDLFKLNLSRKIKAGPKKTLNTGIPKCNISVITIDRVKNSALLIIGAFMLNIGYIFH
ncbi:hypothetical protein AWH66_2014990 [Vibrio barjaei]|nr:hypothetical protein AWH66_2014990 [Vibrio barjaei]